MWDNRFHILTSKSNPKLHEFFRAYFDKPSNKKQERTLLPSKLENPYPDLYSTINKFSHRIPTPSSSRKKLQLKETGWDPNFHVKVSKDNPCFIKSYREYFDNPLTIDYKSTSKTKRNLSLSSLDRKSKPLASMEKFYWNSLYEPISERNIVKHKSKRLYFS
jgi:hypothetical protein